MKKFSMIFFFSLSSLFVVSTNLYAYVNVLPSELEEDHRMSLDFVTPHTKWAKPYEKGTINILFFVDASPNSLKPRECVELMQRFDINAEAVFYGRIVDTNTYGIHGGTQDEARLLKLLERQWDVFVFFEVSPTLLSEEAQYKILEKVTEGAGLVLSGIKDARILKDKNRIELPPFLKDEMIEACFTIGKGRGVLVSQQPFLSYYEGWQTDYDHWQEKFGRAIFWAAGKAPDAELSIKTNCKKGVYEVYVSLKDTKNRGKLNLNLSVKSPVEEKFSLKGLEINTGKDYNFPIPHLPEGEYYIDVIVSTSDGKVVTWSSETFFIDSYRFVRKVVLKKRWGEPGEKISGEVLLVGSNLPEEKVRISLLDRYRRELTFKEISVKDFNPSFEFDTYHWMPLLLTVEAKLFSGEKEISSAYSYYRVTRRNRGEFNFMMWGCPEGTLAPYAEEQLAKSGVTLQLAGGNPSLIPAAYNISWVPYTTRITPCFIPDESRDKSYRFPFCFNDRDAITQHSIRLAKQYQKSREHGVFAYSLGDETTTQCACLSSHCLDAYRSYLKEIYRSIENLNRSWSTTYKDWSEIDLSDVEEVTQDDYRDYIKKVYTRYRLIYLWFYSTDTFPPLTPDKNFYRTEEVPAWKNKNYTRWYDRQAFKSYSFAKLCETYGKAFSSIDPYALTGFEGAGRFKNGDDIDLIVRKTGWWLPYPDTADEVIRSIVPKNYPRGNWMGYSKDADSLLSVYWRMVTRGMNIIAWWTWSVLGPFHGWIAPDLNLFPATAEIVKDTQFMRDGLGNILMNSEMQDDGVAILFSHPSYYARLVENGPEWGDYTLTHEATHTFIREMGFNFSYVTDRMLRSGEFDKNKFRILFLPATEAIGEKEVSVIEDFVRSGGTLVADVRPGIYNDRCKMLGAGIMDHLFGVRRKSSDGPKTAEIKLEGISFSGKVDTGIELAGGTALGSAGGYPVMIVNKIGKGQAILFNFPITSIPSFKDKKTSESIINYFLKMLESSGVIPVIKITDIGGEKIRNLEIIRWKNEKIDIVALFRQGGTDQDVKLILPSKRHVYDIRNKQYLGYTDVFNTKVLKNRASFYVLCEEKLNQPVVKIPSSVKKGDVLKMYLSIPYAYGLQALKIKVENDGRHLEWYDMVVMIDKTTKEVSLPIAYNDPQGKYEVSITDLFTASTVKKSFNVK